MLGPPESGKTMANIYKLYQNSKRNEGPKMSIIQIRTSYYTDLPISHKQIEDSLCFLSKEILIPSKELAVVFIDDLHLGGR